MYSLGVFWLVFISVVGPPLSFLPSFLAGQPQAGPRQWFLEDVSVCLKCCFAIWGTSAGRKCGRKKILDWEAKKTSLFVEETKQQPLVANRCRLVPPCSNKLLILNYKLCKSLQELATLRVFELVL